MSKRESLRDLFKSDRPVLGVACTFASSQIVDIFCAAGIEYLFIDTEHTLVDRSALASLLQAAEIWGTPVIVRAAWNAPELIGWPLDFGAEGIAAPMINAAHEAERLVHAARYPPKGSRSFGGSAPSVIRSLGAYDIEAANRRAVCIAMIETQEAVENIDEITRVEGLDAIFVGQSDLGIAYGLHPSRVREDPGHVDRVRRIAEVALRNDVAPLIICDKIETARELHQAGYRYLMKTDVSILLEATKSFSSWIL